MPEPVIAGPVGTEPVIAGVGALMEPAPTQWGLRGDPVLWERMREWFRDVPVPEDEAGLRALFAGAFAELVGASLDGADRVHRPELDRGGMSGGTVPGRFWRETACTLVAARFKARRGASPA